MAELPGNVHSFRTILKDRREILEKNIPFELSARLIEKGILEPMEQDKLKQIRKSSGLQECQKEFTKMLIEKESWTDEEMRDLKACLEQLNEMYLINKIYLERVERIEPMEMENANHNAGHRVVAPTRGSSNVTVIGSNNQVISNSTVNINH